MSQQLRDYITTTAKPVRYNGLVQIVGYDDILSLVERAILFGVFYLCLYQNRNLQVYSFYALVRRCT